MKKSREILTHKIQQAITKPFSDELIKLIRPAVRITPEKNHSNKLSLSKFGGIPLIKKGEKWIRTEKHNEPYAFLLQIDLEEISSFDIENRLPQKGILSFWINTWDDGKIIYHKNKDELIRATLPIEYEEIDKRKKLPFWKRFFTPEINFRLYPECKLSFEIEYHAPSWDSLQMKLFHIKNNTKYRDLDIDEDYIVKYYEDKPDHHLFGYYLGLQESIYELTRITKGRYKRKLSQELINEGLKWKLLLQIDTDDITDMSWVDGGKILFFIQEEDLKKEKFDNLIVRLDTT